MTSNLASKEIANYAMGKLTPSNILTEEDMTNSKKFKDAIVKPILQAHFKRDEFLGRITEFVYFLPFSGPELLELVKIELKSWAKIAMENNDIQLIWDQNAVHFLAKGYDISYGARSINHEVERRIAAKLNQCAERGLIGLNSRVLITADDPVEKDINGNDVQKSDCDIRLQKCFNDGSIEDIILSPLGEFKHLRL